MGLYGRTGIATNKTLSPWILALPLVLAVAFSFVLPYIASFFAAFTAGGNISVWKNTTLFRITLFTFKQGFFSVIVALVLGLPGAWLLGMGKIRFSPLLRIITALPFAMPSILVVLGFVLFFGNSGWLNTIMCAVTGASEGPVKILYKSEAIYLAHGFYNFPLVIRLVGDGLSRAKKSYAPAAASLGATPIKSALTVILPLALPSILSAALLVFLYSFTSFAVVLVLGGGPASTTLSVEIYRYAKLFLDYRNAGLLAFLETLIAVSIFAAYIVAGKKSRLVQLEIEEHGSDKKNKSILLKTALILYCVVIAFFVAGPLVSIVLESFLYQSSRSATGVLSLRWWKVLGAASMGTTFLPALVRSLVLAFSSATLACFLSILAAGAVTLNEKKSAAGSTIKNTIASTVTRFLAASPVISSGIVLGLGWLILYGRNSSPFTLIMVHSVLALPFAFNFIYESFRSLPANILSASSVLGAGPVRTLASIALPLSFKRVRSAWGFAAALSLGELNTVMMLGMERWETLPLYIFRAVGAYRYGTACAAGTILLLCCAFFFLLSENDFKLDA